MTTHYDLIVVRLHYLIVVHHCVSWKVSESHLDLDCFVTILSSLEATSNGDASETTWPHAVDMLDG